MASATTHGRATVATPVRVLRAIARMNVGGPAHHVSLLSGRGFPQRYSTLLVSGSVGQDEGSFDDLADRHGARLRTVPHLGPEINPAADALALRRLIGIMRAYRPQIVHTHTAKAGLLARTAALAVRPRPIIVHTYHGHVLEGYFSDRVAGAFTAMERTLADVSDHLIGISQSTVDDLVRLGVAPREKFRVVPLGLQLQGFLDLPVAPGGPFRSELGLREDEVLVTFTGRLVPIKRLDVLLDAVATTRSGFTLAIVGDGPEREALKAQTGRLGLSARVRFVGYRRDLADILHATDVAVLSSDNEGTPVSLIEAGAAARPLVSTKAGGVADVVPEGTGLLVDRGDAAALGSALDTLAADRQRRRAMGLAARAHAGAQFTPGRLIERIAALYDELLDAR